MDNTILKLHDLQTRSSPVESLASQSKNGDAEFARWINSHRDSVKNIYSVLEVGGDEEIAAVPAFLKAQHDVVLSHIDSYELTRRQTLDTTTNKFDIVMVKVEKLYENTSERASQLRRNSRHLAAIGDDLAANGRKKEVTATKLLSALRRIEETRARLLRRIQNPQWEVSHHFHMTALEHFRGNTQPHLMDIAVALPGQLRVCAMAKQTRTSNNNVFAAFQKVKEERDELLQGLDEVNKRREVLKNKLTDTSKILEIMRSKMGPEIELHLERLKGSKKHHKSRTKGYMHIKMRYFQKLNLGGRHPLVKFDQDEQKDLGETIKQNSDKGDATSLVSRASSNSLSMGYVDSKVGNYRETKEIRLKTSDRRGSNSSNGSQKESVAFRPQDDEHALGEPGALSKHVDNTNDFGEKSKDWEELGDIVEDIKKLNTSRERALGELEFALDCREHLRKELDDLRRAYQEKVDSVASESSGNVITPSPRAMDSESNGSVSLDCDEAEEMFKDLGLHDSNELDNSAIQASHLDGHNNHSVYTALAYEEKTTVVDRNESP